MTKTILAVCALAVFASVASAKEAKKDFKLVHVDDVVKQLASKNPPAIYDANNAQTRTDAGVVPGAKLLSSSSKFNVSKELPADKSKPLVFYCANEQCMASHAAAKKAVKAGYSDVAVMSDGIYGWKKAGQPTETYKKL